MDILKLGQNLAFIDDRFDRPLIDNSGFRHLFHGVEFVFNIYFPHFTETTLPDAVEVVTTVLGDHYT